MPVAAWALLATFLLISLGAGALAAWVVGPWRWSGVVLPAAAAVVALYLAGHRLAWSIGPHVRLFGFDVALPFDLALAVVVALAVAWLQVLVASAVTRA